VRSIDSSPMVDSSTPTHVTTRHDYQSVDNGHMVDEPTPAPVNIPNATPHGYQSIGNDIRELNGATSAGIATVAAQANSSAPSTQPGKPPAEQVLPPTSTTGTSAEDDDIERLLESLMEVSKVKKKR